MRTLFFILRVDFNPLCLTKMIQIRGNFSFTHEDTEIDPKTWYFKGEIKFGNFILIYVKILSMRLLIKKIYLNYLCVYYVFTM